MKKFSLYIMMAFAALVMVSCGATDDKAKGLDGTWQSDDISLESESVQDNMVYFYSFDSSNNEFVEIKAEELSFADGKGFSVMRQGGTYTFENDTITLNYSKEKFADEFTLNSESLSDEQKEILVGNVKTAHQQEMEGNLGEPTYVAVQDLVPEQSFISPNNDDQLAFKYIGGIDDIKKVWDEWVNK